MRFEMKLNAYGVLMCMVQSVSTRIITIALGTSTSNRISLHVLPLCKLQDLCGVCILPSWYFSYLVDSFVIRYI